MMTDLFPGSDELSLSGLGKQTDKLTGSNSLHVDPSTNIAQVKFQSKSLQ